MTKIPGTQKTILTETGRLGFWVGCDLYFSVG